MRLCSLQASIPVRDSFDGTHVYAHADFTRCFSSTACTTIEDVYRVAKTLPAYQALDIFLCGTLCTRRSLGISCIGTRLMQRIRNLRS